MVAYGCSIHIILLPIIFLFIFSLFYLYPFSSNNNIPNIFSFPTNNNSRHENQLSLSISPALSPFPNNPNSTVLVMTVDNKRPKKEISRLERIEQDLARARAEIQKAVKSDWTNCTSNKEQICNFISEGAIYRNAHSFYQSHIEMKKRFKIWIYREGDQPLVHGGPLNNIYGIEGQFIDEMESGKSHFIARHPDEANAFFIPISVVKIVNILYKPIVTYSREQLQTVVEDYIRVIADKYPYWNRSSGADHFLVSCHDWAPDISAANPKFFNRFIRVLCNANTSEGFNPQRDVSIPEINIPMGKLGPNPQTNSPNKRNILAFFAGGAHGYIRNLLLQHWKDKDNEVQVYEYLKREQNYFKLMGSSKFCLCPSGYEVASPRIVTAIVVGCVPVIISDNYTLPFSDVLKWSKFSIHIPSEKIQKLKIILQRVSDKRYLQMQERLIQVQKHFVINRPAKPYDMIHMLLHSVWLRRLNIRLHN